MTVTKTKHTKESLLQAIRDLRPFPSGISASDILDRSAELAAASGAVDSAQDGELIAYTFPHEVDMATHMPEDYGDFQITLRPIQDDECSMPLYTHSAPASKSPEPGTATPLGGSEAELQRQLDALHGHTFSERDWHALKDRAERAEKDAARYPMTPLERQLAEAARIIALIPIEDFNKQGWPHYPLMVWNGYELNVGHVLAARKAIAAFDAQRVASAEPVAKSEETK